MVSVVAVVQVGMSVVAEVSMVSMVGKSVAMVETVSVVGIAMVVEGIGIGFRGSDSSGLGISGPLAIVVAIETVGDRGETMQRTSMDGGHTGDSSHKRVAVVAAIVGISISSRLSISRPLAVVVSEVSKVGVSIVAVVEPMAIGEAMAVVVAKMVAIAVAMGVVSIGRCISISISCHGSKEAKSSNGHGFHHD